MTNIKSVFFIFLALFLLNGCASFPGRKRSDSAGVATVGIPKFDDVPVPAGFTLLANESFIFQTDTTRVGLLKYAGRPSADKVVNFYREQMPQFGWSMLNIVEYGKRILNFDRLDQSCVITIEPLTTRTLITISVAPKSKGMRQ